MKCFFSNRKWWAVLYTRPEMNHSSREILITQIQWNPKHFEKKKLLHFSTFSKMYMLVDNRVCTDAAKMITMGPTVLLFAPGISK